MGQLNLLAVVDVSGVPTWLVVTTGTFDYQCKHVLAVTVPGGAAGLDITFLSIGFTDTGLQASNYDTVQFQ